MSSVWVPLGYIWAAHVTLFTMRNMLTVASASLKKCIFKKDKTTTQVLFFPDKLVTCKFYLEEKDCALPDCQYAHKTTSLSSLIHCLASACKTIDVCVFTITSQDLADVLIRQHKDGVKVRVVTDCEKMDLNCSQIEQFRACGIQVRHDKTSYFMHHKFAIVDQSVLINGSFNWTRQAITGNQENVIISDNGELLRPYIKQFEVLWNLYNPEAR